jgi:hypothetical protein
MHHRGLLRLAISLMLTDLSLSACGTPVAVTEPIPPAATSRSAAPTVAPVLSTPAPVSSSTFTPESGLVLQAGNNLPKTRLRSKRARELADNRIGHIFGNLWRLQDFQGLVDTEISGLGAKRIRLSINEADADQVDWSRPELEIDPIHDRFITNIAAEGITITYRLQFWDKAYHASGGQVMYPRFKTEDQIQRYLDFVRFIVRHFKDRVHYYEIWNEPSHLPADIMTIEVGDYINLVRRAIPVIRQEDPPARIAIGSISGMNDPTIREYLFTLLKSDVMPLVHVVTWHPMFSTSPEFDRQYYYDYPSIVQQIKAVASVHGFKGEYMAEELAYRSPDCLWCSPSDPLYSNSAAAKYYARGILLHLGMDVSVGIAGSSSLRRESFTAVQNLCTLMAGAKPERVPVEIQGQVTNIKNYGFALPNGDRLAALWTDGVAVDNDPGVKTTLVIRSSSAQKVIGIDILNSFEQQIITAQEGGDIVIRDLFVKDYPIILRFTK